MHRADFNDSCENTKIILHDCLIVFNCQNDLTIACDYFPRLIDKVGHFYPPIVSAVFGFSKQLRFEICIKKGVLLKELPELNSAIDLRNKCSLNRFVAVNTKSFSGKRAVMAI